MSEYKPRPCVVPDCVGFTTPKTARGMCKLHYGRMRRLGSTDLPDHDWMKDRACIVEGCPLPGRRFDRCDSHGGRYAKFGDDILARRWSTGRVCVVCGAKDWPPNGRRVCCSAICFYYKQVYGGPPPLTSSCVTCGDPFDLWVLDPQTGRLRPKIQRSARFCEPCRKSRGQHLSMSCHALAKRDGLTCGICGEPVDLTLKRPNQWSPSVDHVVPRALGGSEEPENLQLAHLWCNQVKQARPDFVF